MLVALAVVFVVVIAAAADIAVAGVLLVALLVPAVDLLRVL